MKRNRTASLASRRESLIVITVWVAACAYTIGYAALFAYRPGAPRILFGIPQWVVWGVLAPWIVSLAVTLWFALCYMEDESLGDAHSE
jgi:hypothetical protein